MSKNEMVDTQKKNQYNCYPKVSHNFAVCDGSDGDKHFKELALRQILWKVVDD